MYEADGYLGFTFAGHHSSEFGLLVVSDGSRYHQNLSSAFNDTIVNVPGYNGGYYFGTQINTRDFEINCAFDNITSRTKNEIQHWLYPNKVGWLIFDETPYKKYLVKVSEPINFNYLPFNNYDDHKNYYFEKDILKGEFTISFFSFKEYAIGNEEYQRPIITKNKLITQQEIDSGLIPENYNILNGNILLSNTKIEDSNIFKNNFFSIYNAGNGTAVANFYFDVSSEDLKNGIKFINLEDGQTYIILDFSAEKRLNGYENYRVKILGDKKEIWAYGIENNIEKKDSKTNIGGYYNQYYPKIYHTKMTQVLILAQTINSDGDSEPLFYPVFYNNKDFLPSDSLNESYYFDEIKNNWSDYTMCTYKYTKEINDVLNPSTLYVELQGDKTLLLEDSLIYLIYPNKFQLEGHITNFTPIYENTYI